MQYNTIQCNIRKSEVYLTKLILVDNLAIIALPSMTLCRPLLTAARIIFPIFFLAVNKVFCDKSNKTTLYLISKEFNL